MTVSLFSDSPVTINLWELCPEASDDAQVIIDGVSQSLPKLLYDYNTWPLTVEQREKTIGLISCNLLRATDIQGHFQLTYTASLPSTLTLRFKDNDSTELFSPLIYDINSGRGSIGVPHSYLRRLAGYHNFVVTAQVAEGEIAIGTRGLLYTIDGGYLATRTSDMGNTISDITIQQRRVDASPSYIWVASIEAGEALIRRRVFSPKVVGEAFEPVYSLGRAKLVAIEFDGEWILNSPGSDKTYRFITYDEPMCFFTDTSDKLYVQNGNDESTRVELADKVVSISVCRGYKSTLYPEQDQGLICVYRSIFTYQHLYDEAGNIIDSSPIHKAYYRQYAYDKTLDGYTWTNPVEITEDIGLRNVINASVHRLNDYRVGIILTTEYPEQPLPKHVDNIEQASRNVWFISSRTYVGMSSRPELVELSPVKNYAPIQMIDAPRADYERLTVSCRLVNNRYTVRATFNHPVRCVSPDVMRWLKFPGGNVVIGRDDFGNITKFGNYTGVDIYDNVIDIHSDEKIIKALTFSLNLTNAWQYYTGTSEENNDGEWIGMHSQMSWTVDPYVYLYANSPRHTQKDLVEVSLGNVTFNVLYKDIGDVKAMASDFVVFEPTIEHYVDQISTQDTYASSFELVDVEVKSITHDVQLLHTGDEPI
jgi:hypothetical protein